MSNSISVWVFSFSSLLRRALFIVVLCWGANTSAEMAYRFSHIAGYLGGPGAIDGTPDVAKFSLPQGVAVDRTGNIYVADRGNSTIRKISPSGVVSTIAGLAGHIGAIDGPAGSARFNHPMSLTIDDTGNLYVADTNSYMIRKISVDGVVSTLAGQPGFNYVRDGDRFSALLGNPTSVVYEKSGNLYFTDGNMVRKISPSGVVTTIAGGRPGATDGLGKAAQFNLPLGLALDKAGNIFVADTNNGAIRKITPDDNVTTFAGNAGQLGSSDGVGSAARFSFVAGLAFDRDGDLFVADFGNFAIRKITPDGNVTTVAGLNRGMASSVDGVGQAARFSGLSGLAIDASDNLYIADDAGDCIRRMTPAYSVTTVAGLACQPGYVFGAGSSARFFFPAGIAVDSVGTIYIAEQANHIIRKIGNDGLVYTIAGAPVSQGSTDGNGTDARFSDPSAIAIDAGSTLYVADTGNNTIRKITPEGAVTTIAGKPGQAGYIDGVGSTAKFNEPTEIALDAAGNVFITEIANHTIRKISTAGVVTTVAGIGGQSGFRNGPSNQALFTRPEGIAVGADGAIFVVDTGSNTIRKISPDGIVSTFAGTPGIFGWADGTGADARFSVPGRLAIDNSQNLYVSEHGNNTIRKISPTADVTTVGGMPGLRGSDDGVGTSASFSSSVAIAIDHTGNLFLADQSTHFISKGALFDPMARAVNLSTRSYVGTGDNVMIAGFIIGGTSPKSVLIRASGPALTRFNVTGVLADPLMTLYSGSTPIRTNDNWGDVPAEKLAILDAAQAVHAFAWDEGSKESAMLATLNPGAYTAVVSGKNGTTGIALIEIYEMDGDNPNSKLINLSTRSFVKTGDNIQIAGLIVSGAGPKQVVIRASGPALAKYGVSGYLTDPVIELHNNTRIIATSDNWDPQIRPDFIATSTDNWEKGSKDAALTANLPSGAYTILVRGKNDTSGVALIEVFEED